MAYRVYCEVCPQSFNDVPDTEMAEKWIAAHKTENLSVRHETVVEWYPSIIFAWKPGQPTS